jgi:hypothetical protein
MASQLHQWGEDEWQDHVNALLATHHSLREQQYQPIPDTGGDCGLEGVSSAGDGYQAYADQDSKDNKDRTRKQKKKIGDDLPKLDTYSLWWTEFLQEKKLRTWTLIVPQLDDKEVVKFARKKAKELRDKRLPFIAEDFEAFVKTADDFPQAGLIMSDPRLPGRAIGPTAVTEQALADFGKNQPDFVRKIDDKVQRILGHGMEDHAEDYRNQLLMHYLTSSNYLENLRQKFPNQWEELDALIESTAASVRTEGIIDERPPHLRLKATRREFEETLKSSVKYMDATYRQTVSWGTVARWLGECPLDFPRVDNV